MAKTNGDWMSTGIPTLDGIIDGFRRGRAIALTGGAGCGKTVLGLQFAHSCTTQGKRTVYLTSEERAEDLRFQAKGFGWDLEGTERQGRLTILEISEKRALKFVLSSGQGTIMKGDLASIPDHVPEGTEVFVLDSLGLFSSKVDQYDLREHVTVLIDKLLDRDITALIILDAASPRESQEVVHHAAAGAIRLIKRDNPFTGKRERAMDIVKMRGTSTPVELLSFVITNRGIEMSTPTEVGK